MIFNNKNELSSLGGTSPVRNQIPEESADLLKANQISNGMTLIEGVVYVALLGMISVFMVNFMIQLVNTYTRVRAEREVISNGRLMLEQIQKALASGREIYGPTSSFNTDLGQLSLVSETGAPAGHSAAYLDFWVDNGIMRSRQEGLGELAISASSVRVTKFRVERIMQGLAREGIKISLRVDYNTSRPEFATSITLESNVALRGNY